MHYKIFIDGEEKLNVVNEKPQLFTNVKIFASDEWHGAADAEYKNLCFENIDEEEHRGKVKVKKNGRIHQMLSEGCSQLHTDDGGVSFNGQCYKYVAEKKTRSEAAKACNVNKGV